MTLAIVRLQRRRISILMPRSSLRRSETASRGMPRVSVSQNLSPADRWRMNKRLAAILAVGLASVLAVSGYVFSVRASADTIRPLPHWGLYSNATWASLQSRAAAGHLIPGSIAIVTGATLESNREPFAILRVRTTSGHNCFAVATGVSIGPPVCRVSSPVMLFTHRDTCAACAPGRKAPLKTVTALALVRKDVGAVVRVYDGRGANVERFNAAGGVSAFTTSFRTGTTLKVLDRSNRMLTELHLRLGRISA